jgi:hypothetical protein
VARRLIDIEHRDRDGQMVKEGGLQPHLLLVENQQIRLFGYSADSVATLVPVDRIRSVTLRDGSFPPNGAAEQDLRDLRSP